ncbi:hypothetical protein V492_01029 [Pseudogymnoascus sp. VKM F-4246]|nr:hypothetical protein V492_01029 [Pseudogymnoascus sp. VKM F-4246]
MMREHVAAHGVKAKEHKTRPLWRECMLQTYFTGKGRIDYFVVVDDDNNKKEGGKSNIRESSSTPLKREEKALFTKLEEDYEDVKGDIKEQASIVHGFAGSRSERVPWLERLGFPSHIATLKDEEVRSSTTYEKGVFRRNTKNPARWLAGWTPAGPTFWSSTFWSSTSFLTPPLPPDNPNPNAVPVPQKRRGAQAPQAAAQGQVPGAKGPRELQRRLLRGGGRLRILHPPPP